MGRAVSGEGIKAQQTGDFHSLCKVVCVGSALPNTCFGAVDAGRLLVVQAIVVIPPRSNAGIWGYMGQV